MKQLFSILKQEIQGVINITLPIIMLAYIYPQVLFNVYGRIICSLSIGCFLAYRVYKATWQQAKNLQFAPSGLCKTRFEEDMHICSINPEKIAVRYGYSNELIALNMFNTVSIDPLLWHDIEKDPEAIKAHEILSKYILPQLSENQLNRIAAIRHILTPQAQRFIFKHELGHALYKSTYKKIVMIALIATIATWVGISVALLLSRFLGIISIIAGMVSGGISDLLLAYTSNALFKYPEERKADNFAAIYSSIEEIEAAAHFFEQHQEILDTNNSYLGILRNIPSILLHGYETGFTRARYLRTLVSKKHYNI
jgi:hypothetical protein